MKQKLILLFWFWSLCLCCWAQTDSIDGFDFEAGTDSLDGFVLGVDTDSIDGESVSVEAGGGDYDTTGLIAWYDFNDATDSFASYDLAESDPGNITYTGGYGVAENAPARYWQSSAIGSVFGNSGQDWSIVTRVRPRSNNGSIVYGNSGRTNLTFRVWDGGAGELKTLWGSIGSIGQPGSSDLITYNQWYHFAVVYVQAEAKTYTYVNGVLDSVTPTAGSPEWYSSTIDLANSGAGSGDVDMDYMGFFGRSLDGGDVAAYYNENQTLTYPDL